MIKINENIKNLDRDMMKQYRNIIKIEYYLK